MCDTGASSDWCVMAGAKLAWEGTGSGAQAVWVAQLPPPALSPYRCSSTLVSYKFSWNTSIPWGHREVSITFAKYFAVLSRDERAIVKYEWRRRLGPLLPCGRRSFILFVMQWSPFKKKKKRKGKISENHGKQNLQAAKFQEGENTLSGFQLSAVIND